MTWRVFVTLQEDEKVWVTAHEHENPPSEERVAKMLRSLLIQRLADRLDERGK